MAKKKLVFSWDDIPIVFDIALAQAITGFSACYIRQMAREGNFPARKLQGGHWRIDKADFIEWWENNLVGSCKNCNTPTRKEV